MTRKRFVKMLMSYGVERNVASMDAYVARCCCMPYQTYFNEIMIPIMEGCV